MATIMKAFFATVRCLLTLATSGNRGTRYAACRRLEAEMAKCGK